MGALCFYWSAYLGKKNLLKKPTPPHALYINNRVYPFYVTGFFVYLAAFLLNLIYFPNVTRQPILLLLPVWLTFFLAVLFFGLFLFFALPPIYYLGQRALTTQKDQVFNPFQPLGLVVTGPFLHCRHPMALGVYSLYLGFIMLYPSPYSLISVFLGFIPAHLFFLIHYEQTELEVRFGQQYLVYKAQTPFIFPRLGSSPKKPLVEKTGT